MLLYQDSLEEALTKALQVSGRMQDEVVIQPHCTLEKQMEYLSMYANWDYTDATICVLYPDFAPYSFSFCMYVKAKPGRGLTKADYQVQQFPALEGYTFWFNGGLIFHGRHDNGGDGSAPTFSVNLSPVNGWAVHT